MIDCAALARTTLPGLVLDRARRTPDAVAFRGKELGIYRETSWRHFADRVAAVALALQARGIGRGDRVAIMGHACPEWTIADLAGQAAGATSYDIYPTSAPAELAYLLRHGGARILVAEDQEHLDRALAVAPTFVFTVPRYLQKIASHLLVALESAGPVKRAAYRAAMAVGRHHLARHWAGQRASLPALAYAAARTLVFARLLDKVGFRHLRLVLSGGVPLPREVAALWQVWGVNVLEVYGQTEAAGAILTGQQGDRPRPGNVGVPAPTVELALGPEGEICARSRYFFTGYWQDADAVASLGIAVARYKLLAFVASSVVTAVAGAVWAYQRSFVSVEASASSSRSSTSP